MDTIGVIFDMDGVLVDSAAAHLQSWQALAVELSRTITPEQFARTFGQRSAEIIAQLFGVFDATEVKRLDARKEFLYRGLIRGRVPEMPGATSLIDRLHHAGFRLAIGSSGPPENVEMVIGELGWGGRLDAIVTGMDVQRGKPDPQVFELAAERLRAGPPNCVVVEDAPAGIEAARRAGMACIALAGSHRPDALGAANRVVGALADIDAQMICQMIRS